MLPEDEVPDGMRVECDDDECIIVFDDDDEEEEEAASIGIDDQRVNHSEVVEPQVSSSGPPDGVECDGDECVIHYDDDDDEEEEDNVNP
jgi:hypothetical protein